MANRHSEMLELAIAKAKELDLINDLDEGIVSVARAAAFALDSAESQQKPGYIIAQLLTPYREALAELKLTPSSRMPVQKKDAFDDFLTDVTTPTGGYPGT